MTKLKTIFAAWLFILASLIAVASALKWDTLTYTMIPIYWMSVAFYWAIGGIA